MHYCSCKDTFNITMRKNLPILLTLLLTYNILYSCTFLRSIPYHATNKMVLLSVRKSPFAAEPNIDLLRKVRNKKLGRTSGDKITNMKSLLKQYPTFLVGNFQPIRNKMNQLCWNVNHNQCFRSCCEMCFKEPWLISNITEQHIRLDGYKLSRSDTTFKADEKKGEGVCIFKNNKWYSFQNSVLKYKTHSPNSEELTVSVKPYCLPRESSKYNVYVVHVYIPPSASTHIAAERSSTPMSNTKRESSDTLKIVIGDCNKIDNGNYFTSFHELFACPKLFLLYCKALAQLGRSDQNLVRFLPSYWLIAQRKPASERGADLDSRLLGNLPCFPDSYRLLSVYKHI